MMELIIGRESGVPRDQARLALQTGLDIYYVGAKGSVPSTVSRMHCKISVSEDATMTVENISSSNLMFINGHEYARRSGVKMTDTLELGPDKYKVNMAEIFTKIPSIKPSFSIKHLESVYNGYQKEKLDFQIRQGRLNGLSSLPGVLSMLSIAVTLIPSDNFIPPENQLIRPIMYTLALLFAIAFGIIRYITGSKNPIKSREMDDRFREKYICPNPGCHHFMGLTPYKELLKNGSCPYCKSKFKE